MERVARRDEFRTHCFRAVESKSGCAIIMCVYDFLFWDPPSKVDMNGEVTEVEVDYKFRGERFD